MYKLYEFALSGNCYKVRLALSFLKLEYERIAIDITKGESRNNDFLVLNSNGKVPVLKIKNDVYLAESNAILWYLASETQLLPSSKLQQAQVLKWMSFEQSSHQPLIAGPRYWTSILNSEKQYKTLIDEKRPNGYAALDLMEQHLKQNNFFVGNSCSIADISLYAYTHVAHEGGYNIREYVEINNWFNRIKELENYVSINKT